MSSVCTRLHSDYEEAGEILSGVTQRGHFLLTQTVALEDTNVIALQT